MSKGNGPEASVLAGCLRYLAARGIYHWRNSTGAVRIAPGRFMRFGKKGSSDILGILPGGRLSPEQKQFLVDVRELGAMALVVRGWRELDQALREEGYADDGPLFENAAPYGGAKNNNR